jgi:hypothetical protein
MARLMSPANLSARTASGKYYFSAGIHEFGISVIA